MLVPEAYLDPSSRESNKLIEDLFSGRPLHETARAHNLSLTRLLKWTRIPQIAETIASLKELFALHTELAAAEIRGEAIARLRDMLNASDLEHARKAASTLLRLVTPQAALPSTPSAPSPSPKPTTRSAPTTATPNAPAAPPAVADSLAEPETHPTPSPGAPSSSPHPPAPHSPDDPPENGADASSPMLTARADASTPAPSTTNRAAQPTIERLLAPHLTFTSTARPYRASAGPHLAPDDSSLPIHPRTHSRGPPVRCS